MNRIPCITDSDEFRYPAEEHEEESPLTDVEKRISWVFDAWQDAIKDDNYDEWQSVYDYIYGAIQTMTYASGLHLDSAEMRILSDVALEHKLQCIREGKYEGA